MKRAPAIAAFVGLAVSASASALNLNPMGTGQVLLYPYYTVNANQDTYFSVANQDSIPKVIKVRFLEGRNGRPALDVDVVLKAHDAWTAAISVDAGGGAKLVTFDDSCTRPAIPAGGIAFTSSGYDGSSTIPADDGPHDIARTREGSVEVIGGANILSPDSTPFSVDCNTVFADLATPAVALAAPGRLFGWAAVIDVGAGHYYSYNATAIDKFTEVPLYSDDWGPLKPTLNDANSAEDDSHRPVAYFFLQGNTSSDSILGVPQRGEYEKGVDAVSAVLIADTIENDYIVDAGLGASTDWVVTMPTLHLYVDPIYPDANDRAAFRWLGCCSAFAYDRSGTQQGGRIDFQLPYSTTVVSFQRSGGPASGVFGSTLDVNVMPAADTGTMRIEMPFDHSQPGAGDTYTGLSYDNGALYGSPVIGFMAYNIVNANAQPGLLGNYGAVADHRRTTCGTSAFINSFICTY